jgi:hypothetical protein
MTHVEQRHIKGSEFTFLDHLIREINTGIRITKHSILNKVLHLDHPAAEALERRADLISLNPAASK